MLLDPPADDGWLAVGDAASAYDPISSQGIHKALTDGIAAAGAIASWLAGDPRGVADYRVGVGERFIEYLEMRNYFYETERRWSDGPFWRRRRVGSTERRMDTSAGATD